VRSPFCEGHTYFGPFFRPWKPIGPNRYTLKGLGPRIQPLHTSLFTLVRGSGILRSPYSAFCMDRPVDPPEDPIALAFAWKSTLHMLALHGYPPQ
jgi:hypothetical protein